MWQQGLLRWWLCFIGLLIAVFAAIYANSVSAASLFGVITERAAPSVLAAAHTHLQQFPHDKIILRTPKQVLAASSAELEQWLRADAVLAASVFADPARRLHEGLKRRAALTPASGTTVLALNGEQSLNRLSHFAYSGQQAGLDHANLQQVSSETWRDLASENPSPAALALAAAHPALAAWLQARQTWQAGGKANIQALLRYLLHGQALPPPQPEANLRVRVGIEERSDAAAWHNQLLPAGNALVVLDLANNENQTAAAICAEARQQGMACIEVFSRWGSSSREAIERLPELLAPARPAALLVLQDFVLGAADNREAVSAALQRLNIPVQKLLRLSDRSVAQWQLSADGLPADSVQYRVALPELQGQSQPMVVAALGQSQFDRKTGLETRQIDVLPDEVRQVIRRTKAWQHLATTPNAQKKVAVIYYNHPPGRQNIGADNLDVPQTLFHLLQRLQAEGYDLGSELPSDSEALLNAIMQRGVNLPEDKAALQELSRHTFSLTASDYQRWFANLPRTVQGEMTAGPLGRLQADVLQAEASADPELRTLGRKRVESVFKEIYHLVEGAEHPQRQRALRDLQQLEAGYLVCLAERAKKACSTYNSLLKRILVLKIEGLRGWGEAPGKVMVTAQQKMVIPGLQFGKVFIGPQPPRGWEVDEELLHANTSIPPPHQFLGFYHWLHDVFQADVVVHLGRHSTYEFLPGKAVGLMSSDYPRLVAGDVPGVYPYIVDGVGEGIQAKRRGLAVMVDHLTPPLAATPLYDQLLNLRQVVESYESASSDTLRQQAAQTMREQVRALNLQQELQASMADVLAVRGIGFEQADDDLLAHEIGHYLTKLQEKFMPYGLHIFGKAWDTAALNLMLDSMQKGGIPRDSVAEKLADSPRQEMLSLLAGLRGEFIPPGKGNDPLRSPEALPTGRNFHGVDGDILPTRLGYQLGKKLAEQAKAKAQQQAAAQQKVVEGSEGVILWASDAVRDEGVMVGFSLALLGAEPVWNARGIVTDVRLLPPSTTPRRDVIVTTSGLFRDLYPNLLNQIDRAGRLALAAAAGSLLDDDPELRPALIAALTPLANFNRDHPSHHEQWGRESLAQNRVAHEWRQRYVALRQAGLSPEAAGKEAAFRIFGDAPGAYGAGVNRLTERSGAWVDRAEVGAAYRLRLGHAYGLSGEGEAAHAAFATALRGIERSYHGRASNLYGLLDNNDAFDYLGGMSLAIEGLTGKRPESLILQHADPNQAAVEPLSSALLGELRGRYLNPAWLKPLMQHGYAGARTMGQEFMENLWGWQVTRPDLIQDWAWDEVKKVYFDDAHHLGLPAFLRQGNNAHVKAHMLSLFMVAAQKGFWHPDQATIQQLGSELAQLVAKNGLPGSGHTSPKHPMWAWLLPQLPGTEAATLQGVLAKADGNEAEAELVAQQATQPATSPRPLVQHQPKVQAATRQNAKANANSAAAEEAPPPRYFDLQMDAPDPLPLPHPAPIPAWVLALSVCLLVVGLWQGARSQKTA